MYPFIFCKINHPLIALELLAIPSIDTAKKIAKLLNTSVGYLLGENEEANLFKNPEMLKRFKDILSFPKEKQEHILFAVDAMIKSTKLETL